MEYPIRIKVEGGADAKTAADGVRAVNDQVERAKKAPTVKAKVEAARAPRAIREAKEDRELDRAADKAQKAIIKEAREREKATAKQIASLAKIQSAKDVAANKSAAKEAAQQAKAESVALKMTERVATQEAKRQAKAESDRVKAIAREDKALDNAANKAQRAIIRDDKIGAKKAEKAEIAKIDPRSAMSPIEKAKERVAKQQASAAKAEESKKGKAEADAAKGLAETKKAANEKLFKPLMIGAALVGASLVGAMTKLAPLAIGYQGMARLAMVSQVASFNLRRLFTGTNPGPLLDAIQRTGQLLDPRTFTGDQLGQFLRRTSDGVMGALAKAEPYVRLFFKGMLLGALQVENGFMRFRIAVQPALNLIPKSAGQMATWQIAAMGVKGAIAVLGIGASIAAYQGAAMAASFARAGVVMGIQFVGAAIRGAGALLSLGSSALAATAPMLPFIAAFAAVALAIKQAIDLKKQWDENSSGQIKKRFDEVGFFGPEKNAVGAMKSNADKRAVAAINAPGAATAAAVPKGGEKVAQPAGMRVGTAMVDGLIAGLNAGNAKAAEAGAKIVLAAEVGAKGAAEIKSPSRKWRREIGMQLGAGASLGIADSADAMSDAAGRAMPGPGKVQAGGGRGGGGSIIISPGAFVFNGVGAEIEMIVRRIVPDVLEDFAEREGAR